MSSNFRSLTFWMPGTPVGQGRPRQTTHVRYKEKDPFTGEPTGEWKVRQLEHPFLHSDPKSDRVQKAITARAQQAMKDAGFEPFAGPVFLGVTAVFVQPASWSKKKKATTVWHTDKPDASNVCKLIEDAGNKPRVPKNSVPAAVLSAVRKATKGILWNDDAQVSCEAIRKLYGSAEGDLVTVAELDPASLSLRPDDCQGVSWPVTPEVARILGAVEQARIDSPPEERDGGSELEQLPLESDGGYSAGL